MFFTDVVEDLSKVEIKYMRKNFLNSNKEQPSYQSQISLDCPT